MKKILLIGLIVFVLIGIVIWRVSLQKVIPGQVPTETQHKTEEVVDLSKIQRGGRYDLLEYMTKIARKGNDEHNTFLLDDNDPSSKVVIGTYRSEYEDNGKKIPGGIIMLKRLPDGKDSIYWEITSPLFEAGGHLGFAFIKDINNDGIKEIVASWSDTIDLQMRTSYWIISVNPHTKTYKVLNVFVDKDKNVQHDFDFEHPDPSKEYLNRFDAYGFASIGAKTTITITDVDGDGLAEIVIINPSLERFSSEFVGRHISLPDNIKKLPFSQTDWFTQTYKWNGKEYYLWKEQIQKDNN